MAQRAEGAQATPLAEKVIGQPETNPEFERAKVPIGAPNNTRAQAKAEEKARRAKEVAERKTLQEAAKRTAIEEQK